MLTDTPPKKRLNLFAFPIETNIRFVMLMVASLSMVLMLASTIQAILVLENYLTLPFEVEFSEPGFDDSGLERYVMEYLTVIQQGLHRLFIPTVLALGMLILSVTIYRSYPSRIRRRKKLQKITHDQKPKLINNIQALSDLANVSPPSIEIEVGSRSIEGQVFGFRKRYSLRLGGRMELLMHKARERFQAIILHELAHIVNTDVWRTYFTQALWIATISLLIPIVAIQSYRLLVGIDWVQWFTVSLPLYLIWILQIAISLAIVAAIRSSILRVREIYADWRAASLGIEGPLAEILAQYRSEDKESLRKRLFKLHPTPQERIKMLEDPTALFRINPDISVFAGILVSFLLSGFFTLATELFLLFMGLTTIAVTVSMQNFPQDSFMFFLLGTVGQIGGSIFSFGLWFIFLLVATFFMAGTVGVQIQLESVAKLVTGRLNWRSYLHLSLPAVLITISIQLGFVIFPQGQFAPISIYIADRIGFLTILRDVLLMLIWIAAVSGLTWLWLVYVRFFSVRVLGSHTGVSPPKLSLYLLMVASSILLWILYLPAVAGQLQISELMAGYEASLPSALPITSVVALVLFPIVFGATLLLVKIYRWIVPPRCTTCGRVTRHLIAVGHACEHCGKDLAPWLFVPSPPKGQNY